MLAWIRRLFAAPPPPPPRLIELWNRVNDVEASIGWLEDSLKQTNARITTKIRKTPSEDAPQPTNGEEPVPEPPPPQKRFQPTAHLSRRFRSF
jgi:hypothetical protein